MKRESSLGLNAVSRKPVGENVKGFGPRQFRETPEGKMVSVRDIFTKPRRENGFNLERKRQKVFGPWQFHETPEGKNGFSPREFHENPEGKITSENTNNHDPTLYGKPHTLQYST